MASKICFPNHVGLPGQPGPPDVDGYIEPEEYMPEPGFGTAPSEVDTGWTGAPRITYIADTAVGAGRPLTAFQGIKHNSADRLYLAFAVRRDTSFDDEDRIVLVFHPNYSTGSVSKTGDERRIDILPNAGGVGAGDAGTTDPGDFSGTIGSNPVTIRANRIPRNVEYYRWNATSGEWQSMAAPSNIDIRVRSWDLGENSKNWSVEVQVPTSIAAGGANWINFTTDFGFYYNVIRICSGAECSFSPTPFDGASFQFTWPRANYTTGERLIQGEVDVSQAEIPPSWLGEAYLGNVAGCSGVKGVKFVNHAASIGTQYDGPAAPPSNRISKTNPNTFVAEVENTATTTAQAVEAEFRIANWGLGPGDANKWNKIPPDSGFTNPSAPQNISAGGNATLSTRWTLDATEQGQYGGALSNHQCIWVLLDSDQAVDFVESSVRRNMNFQPMSEFEQTAEVSGDGYPEPPEGGEDQEFALIVSKLIKSRVVLEEKPPQTPEPNGNGDGPVIERTEPVKYQSMSTRVSRSEQKEFPSAGSKLLYFLLNLIRRTKVLYDLVWIMDGYRKTGFTMKRNEKEFRLYEPTGAFGYIGEHQGLISDFNHDVQPAEADISRFSKMSNQGFILKVPDGGTARIQTKLEAVKFRLPWWFWVIILIILIIIGVIVS